MRYNPGVRDLHPGQVLVLPDLVENPYVSTGNQDFHLKDGFAEEINAMDVDEQKRQAMFEQAKLSERLSPDWGDAMYLGFDDENTPFVTTDETGIPLYYHGADSEHPYSPDPSKTLARWGMIESQPYLEARRSELAQVGDVAVLRAFDEQLAFEDFVSIQEDMATMREKDPQIYAHMLSNLANPADPIRNVEPQRSYNVRGFSGSTTVQPTEEGFENSGVTGDLAIWADRGNWLEEVPKFGFANFRNYGEQDQGASIQSGIVDFIDYGWNMGTGLLAGLYHTAMNGARDLLGMDKYMIAITDDGIHVGPNEISGVTQAGGNVRYVDAQQYYFDHVNTNYIHFYDMVQEFKNPETNMLQREYWNSDEEHDLYMTWGLWRNFNRAETEAFLETEIGQAWVSEDGVTPEFPTPQLMKNAAAEETLAMRKRDNVHWEATEQEHYGEMAVAIEEGDEPAARAAVQAAIHKQLYKHAIIVLHITHILQLLGPLTPRVNEKLISIVH
jgi:hypothetical protein